MKKVLVLASALLAVAIPAFAATAASAGTNAESARPNPGCQVRVAVKACSRPQAPARVRPNNGCLTRVAVKACAPRPRGSAAAVRVRPNNGCQLRVLVKACSRPQAPARVRPNDGCQLRVAVKACAPRPRV